PKWYPVFGSFGVINRRMDTYGSQWKVLSEMSKEFSTNVLGLKLGNKLVVAVYGEKNIRQVITEKEFDGRPDSFFLRLRSFGKRVGITFVDGPLWREHRPFALKHLRLGGFGKQSMEQDIHGQLSNLLNILDQSNGNAISIRTPIAMALINIVWKYVAGKPREDSFEFRNACHLCYGKGYLLSIPISKIVPVVGLKIVNEQSLRNNSEVHAVDEVMDRS
ncbi:jg25440, partial [Pararge aegeria aegeria]